MLYIDFPEGRLKFFGSLVFPKNRYLVLRFGQKDVICEDVLENMVSCAWQSCTCPTHSHMWCQYSRHLAAQVVFAEAWWVGTKESNPDEERLPIPESVLQAGATAAGTYDICADMLPLCPACIFKCSTLALMPSVPQLRRRAKTMLILQRCASSSSVYA